LQKIKSRFMRRYLLNEKSKNNYSIIFYTIFSIISYGYLKWSVLIKNVKSNRSVKVPFQVFKKYYRLTVLLHIPWNITCNIFLSLHLLCIFHFFFKILKFRKSCKNTKSFSEKTKSWLVDLINGFHTFLGHSSEYLQHSVLSRKTIG